MPHGTGANNEGRGLVPRSTWQSLQTAKYLRSVTKRRQRRRCTTSSTLPVSPRVQTNPRGPKGEKRPADVIGNAVHVMRIATGQIEDITTEDGKNAAAVALGRMGGKARAS